MTSAPSRCAWKNATASLDPGREQVAARRDAERRRGPPRRPTALDAVGPGFLRAPTGRAAWTAGPGVVPRSPIRSGRPAQDGRPDASTTVNAAPSAWCGRAGGRQPSTRRAEPQLVDPHDALDRRRIGRWRRAGLGRRGGLGCRVYGRGGGERCGGETVGSAVPPGSCTGDCDTRPTAISATATAATTARMPAVDRGPPATLTSADVPPTYHRRRASERYGARRITTRGVPEAAFEVVGAATSNPARRNMPAVPV